jgi:hypothetical protein
MLLYNKMQAIYCGNNAQDDQLLDGTRIIGTRHGCMKKGFGKGFNMSYDPKFAGPYTPIDKRKIYCGNNSEKPDEYDSIGSLSQCLQKGIGIGKRKRADKGIQGILGYSPNYSPSDYSPSNNYFFKILLIFIVIELVIFSYLYFSRPKIVTTKDHKKIERINWSKFILIYLTSVFLSSLTLFLIYISNVRSNS